MGYDRMSTLLTWGGKIGYQSPEIWQCGVHLALQPSTDGPGLPTTPELVALLDGPLKTFHQTPALAIHGWASLEWVKAASLDDVGHYTTDPIYTGAFPVINGPTTGLTSASPQDSMCITLWSGNTIGRGNYGRFYTPWSCANVDNNARLRPADATAIAEAGGTLIDGINSWAEAALSPSARVVIMSRIGAGLSKRVQVVKCGDVKDTQRRRRNRLHEAYSAKLVTA